MPLFSSSTPFDGDVEKATNEMNTTEDWAVIMDICDKVSRSNGAKDCLKAIVKRLNHKVPYVAMQSLTLLDACINNCGHPFHLEVASRDFVSECRTLIGKGHPKVGQRLKQLIKKWSENEFKSDASLNLIPSLCSSLKSEGHSFSSDENPAKTSQVVSKDPNVVSSQQEEDDIVKAIALSLKEEEKKKSSKTTSLYPAFNAATAAPQNTRGAELRKVRALYDFEAAEDNELTFKGGEFINVMDDGDPNWWKGSNFRGEGLFPANFVTADLTAEPESSIKEKKSVQFSEEVEVKTVEPIPEIIDIDEERIDKTLTMIQNADPTGETHPDPPELANLEEQCKAMNPLIDQELEKIDRKHMTLMEINTKVIDALQMYHNLMKELPGYGYTDLKHNPAQFQPAGGMPPQAMNGHPGFLQGPEMSGLPPGPPQTGMSGPYLPQAPGVTMAMAQATQPASMPPMPSGITGSTATGTMTYAGVNSAVNAVGQVATPAATSYVTQPPPQQAVHSNAPSMPSHDAMHDPMQVPQHNANNVFISLGGPPQMNMQQQPIYSTAQPQQQPLL